MLYSNCSLLWDKQTIVAPKGISKRALAGEKTVSVGVDTLLTQNGRPSPGEVLVS